MTRLSELFTEESGRLSTNRLWFNVGNAAMTAVFVRHGWTHDLTPELLLAYGALVTGNNIANKYLVSKYAARRPDKD